MTPTFFPTPAAFRAWLKKAWEFFCGLPPYYRKLETRWVHSAKQEATRLRRLEKLIALSESGRRR